MKTCEFLSKKIAKNNVSDSVLLCSSMCWGYEKQNLTLGD